MAGGVAQGVGPEFKSKYLYHPKKLSLFFKAAGLA
jgi:hypothetical protein